MSEHLESLSRLVGRKALLSRGDPLSLYTRELRDRYASECLAVLLPSNTGEVAAILGYCHAHDIGVIPQGGNTGTVGATVATASQVIVNLEKMNRVLELDSRNDSITVQAGCVLSVVQQEAARQDRYFPLSLGAEQSCQIGGNLATNAGGINVLHYGNTRDLVLGIEAVLADGRIFNGLKKLRKDNAGYDLRNLLIGSEGTLGIITAATLKLFPQPTSRMVSLVGLQKIEDAIELMTRLRQGGHFALTTMELMSETTIDFAVTHVDKRTWPFTGRYPWQVLLVMTGPGEEISLRDYVEDALSVALDDGLIVDAIIAGNETQAADLMKLREEVVSVQKLEGGSIKHDIAVPVSRVPEFLHRADSEVANLLPGARPYTFGHLGDGNIHYNVSQPRGMDCDHFLEWREPIQQKVFEITHALGGSISAEHGIGLARKAALLEFQDPVALSLYSQIKQALDPKNILNPGKMLDPLD